MPHKSILIVDDEALVRRTARSVLCDLVDVCHEAENGQQAVEKVKELKPDLVLLDISMPVMNGLRAAYEIRQMAPSTKIIFYTVDTSGDARGAAHALGVHAFVTKSEGPKLIQTVKRLLSA
jgi:two-component system chemotaxis response regulator CheY